MILCIIVLSYNKICLYMYTNVYSFVYYVVSILLFMLNRRKS